MHSIRSSMLLCRAWVGDSDDSACEEDQDESVEKHILLFDTRKSLNKREDGENIYIQLALGHKIHS